jgi:omega-6 fatty acid desaturase (delta-12 desaturase)
MVSRHADRGDWAHAQPFISTTIYPTFPLRLGAVLHHIMEHKACHPDTSIPTCRLKAALKMLVALLPERIVIQPLIWRW